MLTETFHRNLPPKPSTRARQMEATTVCVKRTHDEEATAALKTTTLKRSKQEKCTHCKETITETNYVVPCQRKGCKEFGCYECIYGECSVAEQWPERIAEAEFAECGECQKIFCNNPKHGRWADTPDGYTEETFTCEGCRDRKWWKGFKYQV
jgi:hypothetical protein